MCRKQVEVNTDASRALLTLVHIMYLLLILFLLARRSQQVLCLGLERGLKPLPNEILVIIIKINLTTNYQLLLNCNKVHRAWQGVLFLQKVAGVRQVPACLSRQRCLRSAFVLAYSVFRVGRLPWNVGNVWPHS
jgi:hypothetical protein